MDGLTLKKRLAPAADRGVHLPGGWRTEIGKQRALHDNSQPDNQHQQPATARRNQM